MRSRSLSPTLELYYFLSVAPTSHDLYAYLWLNPMQYYLKAQFGYSKNEYANLLLIAGAAGMLSQVPKPR